jgi:tetratricopeptide (TPR) repeat protein
MRIYPTMTKPLPIITLASALLLPACASPPAPPQPSTPPPQAEPKPAAVGSVLTTGFGDHHHPIRTSNPEAQRFFDQGVAMTFGFNHEAAIRSFERAAELDPNAAMPQWGRAWALGKNYNLDIDDPRAKLAFDAITLAGRRAARGPQVERDYVAAMAIRYSADMKADREALNRKYSAAMGELSRKYPDDLDAATLYAESLMNLNPWKLWTLDGKPNPGTEEIVALLQSVLKRDPAHIGANHLYIHAVEASTDPGLALQSASRLETAAPASGHLVHMPAHIYARTGDHAGAARANAAGAAADEKYLVSAGPDSLYGMMYYSHNLQFLADSHRMQGRFVDALNAAQLLAKHLEPHAAMAPMIESMLVEPESTLLRFNRYDEVLKFPAPLPDRPVQLTWHHYARGVAFAQTGKVDDAAAERKALAEAMTKVPDAALFGGGGFAPARDALTVAATALDARIAWARNERDKAVELWQRAIAGADRLPYDEPPSWYYPLRESLGSAYLQLGKPADAERVFREDLTRNPRNGRSLFGLQAALAKQGKDVDAAWIQREFDNVWKNADTQLKIENF